VKEYAWPTKYQLYFPWGYTKAKTGLEIAKMLSKKVLWNLK